jgi:hypothetical protein
MRAANRKYLGRITVSRMVNNPPERGISLLILPVEELGRDLGFNPLIGQVRLILSSEEGQDVGILQTCPARRIVIKQISPFTGDEDDGWI